MNSFIPEDNKSEILPLEVQLQLEFSARQIDKMSKEQLQSFCKLLCYKSIVTEIETKQLLKRLLLNDLY